METILEYLGNLDWLTLGLLALFAFIYRLFDELQDESMKSTWKKHTKFLNSNESSGNKWKPGSTTIPRFWLSSTALVFITDGEHLFQFIKNRAIEVGLLIICWQLAVIWLISASLMSFIKERFLKKIN